MEIFNVQIFGECATEWLKLSKDQKRFWILHNTNQTNEELIEEFICNPKITKDAHCLDCRDKKQKISIKAYVKKKK
jgi:hypothetical protein